MARTSHTKKRSASRSRKQKGGELAGNPPSAWGWGLGTAGDGWRQFMDSLTLQPGQNIAAAKSNDLVPVGKPNAQEYLPPKMAMSGGKHRRSHSSRTKKGGNWGAVLNQVAAPALLLGAQQMYGRKTKRHHKRRH